MDLKQLTYFIAVAERLNFSRAAESLYISQPALSQRISELEAELGVQLLTRSRRSVHLTEAGSVLLQAARDITRRVDQLPQLLEGSQLEDGQQRSLRLALIGDALKAEWFRQSVAAAVFETKSLFPNLLLSVSEIGHDEVASCLSDGSADLCLYVSHLPPDFSREIETRLLCTDRICLIVSKQHPLNHPGAEARELLRAKDAELLLLDMGTGMQLQMSGILSDLEAAPTIRYPQSPDLAMLMTYAGLGMYFYPRRMLSTNTPAFHILDCFELPTEKADLSFYACGRRDCGSYIRELFTRTLGRICSDPESAV